MLAPTVPNDELIAELQALATDLLGGVGNLPIAGSGPRRDGQDYPRLYIVDVRSRAHQQLSTATARMEQKLRVPHWGGRTNYHLSVDELEAIAEFEVVG